MYIFARWLSARNCIRPRTPTLPNQDVTWQSCIIHAAITRKRLSFIALRLRLGRRRMKNPRKIMRLWCRITPTFCVLLARYAKRTNWKFVHARGARANLTGSDCLLRIRESRSLVRSCSTLAYAHCRAAVVCSRGGIGRRVRLRTVWGNPWRFDSSREQFGPPKGLPATTGLDRSHYFALDFLLAAQRAFIR